jgi:hypothetical protein
MLLSGTALALVVLVQSVPEVVSTFCHPFSRPLHVRLVVSIVMGLSIASVKMAGVSAVAVASFW